MNPKAVVSTYDHSRHEWNLLIRRPFYLNLRLGLTQNALWFSRHRDPSLYQPIFNRFPLRKSD